MRLSISPTIAILCKNQGGGWVVGKFCCTGMGCASREGLDNLGGGAKDLCRNYGVFQNFT